MGQGSTSGSDRRAEALATLDSLRSTLQDADTHHGVLAVIADDLADTLSYSEQVRRIPEIVAAASSDA